jgi:Arc/MetJ-type ribon-helix-helix transcriptional regulator
MKKPISATIEQELIDWISEMCKDKQKYRNKSHLIEIALWNLKEQQEKKKK